MRLIISALVAAMLWAGGAEGATYYIDAMGGNDTNSGTATDNAWQTVAKISSSAFSAGDSILFKKGGIWGWDYDGARTGGVTLTESGTVANRITIGSYGTGAKPIIVCGADVAGATGGWVDQGGNVWGTPLGTGTLAVSQVTFDLTAGTIDTTPDGPFEWFQNADALYVYSVGNPATTYTSPGMGISYGYCVHLNGADYVTVQDLDFRFGGAGIFLSGNADNNIVRRLSVSGNPTSYGGIHINGGSGNLVDNNASDNSYSGVVVTGFGGATADNNSVSNNTILRSVDYGIKIDQGATNNIVEHNDVSLCKGTDDRVGIGAFAPGTGNIIRYNKSYNNGDATHRYVGFWVDGDGTEEAVKFHYNVAYGNSNGGYAATGNVAHEFYNNVGYQNNQGDYDGGEINLFFSGENAQGHKLQNNIFVASAGKKLLMSAADQTTGHVIDNNVWYGGSATPFTWGGTAYSFADYKTASSQDSHSLNADPVFVTPGSNFALQASSPARDAGVDVGLTSDYLGNPIKGLPDIGAYEYQGGVTSFPGFNRSFPSFPSFP